MRRFTKKIAAVLASIALIAVAGSAGCTLSGSLSDPGASSSSLGISENADNGEGVLSRFDENAASETATHIGTQLLADAVPEYSGKAYIEVNGNVPDFTNEDKAVPYGTEIYGKLDQLGRCTGAFALVGPETLPTGKRGNISDIKPSGWRQNLDLYPLGLDHLYERSHLIAHKLTAEDANKENLITGTHYLNQGAMSQFETIVGDYVNATGGHVLMRVTPVFLGDELVARGVQMEAYSLEDEGESVSFNVYCYNVQPGVEIDYATGESRLL